MKRSRLLPGIALLVLLAALLAACSGDAAGEPGAPAGAAAGTLTVTSPAFQQEGAIPALYTCTGEDVSPPLAWTPPPQGTQSLALIMDDPDAPGGTWTHWVVYNLPPGTTGLEERASSANAYAFALPAEAMQGTNSFKRTDYGGPCPPTGTHRYYFRVYALDTMIAGDVNRPLDANALRKAMNGHVLAQGELMGVYQK